ncbi:hypothetical protein ET464_11655 [Paenibacillus protaetiae]|uniref:Amino acid transporter n=1 Tax=Paenibacillus protaetiae TaxID=2509456 RepID=A0A4P6EZA7_9BACL|nr:hypothetical protein ET464_11655 [Paenibacillus protaetiae]
MHTETAASRSEVPVFNDATDHYRNIMGAPSQKANLNQMPKPLRWFGYFFYTVIALMVVSFVISYLMNR